MTHHTDPRPAAPPVSRTPTTPAGRRRRHASAGAAIVVAASALAACGYQSPQPERSADREGTRAAAESAASQASALDPCTLIDADQLTELLGSRPTQQGDATDRALGRECSWDFSDPGAAFPGTLTITAWHGSQFFAAGALGAPVAGLGDEAQADDGLGIVLFRVGDDVIQTHVLAAGDDDRARRIAEAVAASL